jgi:hypothetical protein
MAQSQQEIVRAAREQGWSEGYQACYEGQQRHNPYRKPRPADPNAPGEYLGPYGDGVSQPYS